METWAGMTHQNDAIRTLIASSLESFASERPFIASELTLPARVANLAPKGREPYLQGSRTFIAFDGPLSPRVANLDPMVSAERFVSRTERFFSRSQTTVARDPSQLPRMEANVRSARANVSNATTNVTSA